VFSGEFHQAAPAAADVEQAHAGLEPELAADEVELGDLRLLEVVGLRPVAAGVDHAGVEHGLEEVVAEVVMDLADLPCAAQILQVEQAGAHALQHQRAAADLLVEAGAQHATDEFVELLAVPPAVHVALAEPEAAAGQHAIGGLRMVDDHVEGPAAADLHPRFREQFDYRLQRAAASRRGRRACALGVFNGRSGSCLFHSYLRACFPGGAGSFRRPGEDCPPGRGSVQLIEI